MRHQLSLAALTVLVSAFVPSTAAAQSDSATVPGFSIYAETQFVSRYIWRGFDDSRKTASLQPYVEVGMPLGVTASAWATSGLDRHGQLDEAQFGIVYKRALGDWELGVGYLHYVLPGTATEPSPSEDPLATTSSGEFLASVTRNWAQGFATLTYSRGNRAGKGNSVNLWLEQAFATADERWSAQPYLQVDYLDEYGAPPGFENRFSMVEIGVPVTRQLGPLALLASVHVSFIPSPWFRAANGDAGADRNIAIPWFSLGVVYEP